MDKLEQKDYFACSVYMVQKPEFLESVRAVSDRYLVESREHFGESRTQMTAPYSHEPEIAQFAQYVSQTAWNILLSQGYDMEQLATYFTEMWTQEHRAFSSMDTHLHGRGAQVSAFYFLDVPEGGCRFIIHDPRAAKVIISLPEKDAGAVTSASTHVVFAPEPGMLFFTNAWLPHSFTQNLNEQPTRFVHMNLSVTAIPKPEVEVL